MDENANQAAAKKTVSVCCGSSCSAMFSREICDKLKNNLEEKGVSVKTCGCLGFCSLSNSAAVNGNIIARLTPENCVQNVEKALAGDYCGAGGGVDVDPFNLPDDIFLGI